MNGVTQIQRQAFEGWLANINQICGAFDGEPVAAGFTGSIEEYRQGALKMSLVNASQARLLRNRQQVEKTSSHYYFAVFQLAGTASMLQGSSRHSLSAGEIMFIDNSLPSEFAYTDCSRQLSLILPHELIETTLHRKHIAGGLKIGAQLPVCHLATQLLLATKAQGALAEDESQAVLEATLGLLRPALVHGETRLAPHERLFRKGLELIEQQLCSHELTPEFVAHEIGVSMRGLYRIFAKNGLVVAQYIRNRRLDLCAQILRQGATGDKLASVAYTCGFINSSYFTTAFKSRFGVSPSEYRKRYH